MWSLRQRQNKGTEGNELRKRRLTTTDPPPLCLRFYFGVHVVPLQTYNVVLAPPSVRNQSEPLAVGAVPQVEVGAPAPTPIETPLTLVLTLYGPTGATKFPGVNGPTGENTKSPSQNVP